MSERVTVMCMMAPEEVARVASMFPGVDVVGVPAEGELPDDLAGEILFVGGAGANLGPVLDRGVKWVHTIATGLDRFPLELVGGRIFTNSRGAGGIAISEWVLSMMLACAKRLPESWIHEPPEAWLRADLDTLYGRTLGLVGLGGIGSEVARRSQPFGMRITALRRRPMPSPVEGVEIVTELDELLAMSDHLVLATPLTAATTHLLGAHAFSVVKPGVHLVNISRGGLVDQDALRLALDDGRVGLASLDTVDPEPLPAGHWLYTHPKVRLSPHISWSAPWGYDKTYESFGANLERWLAGEPLVGVVDVNEGY